MVLNPAGDGDGDGVGSGVSVAVGLAVTLPVSVPLHPVRPIQKLKMKQITMNALFFNQILPLLILLFLL